MLLIQETPSRKNEDLYCKMLNKDDLTVIRRSSLNSKRGFELPVRCESRVFGGRATKEKGIAVIRMRLPKHKLGVGTG